MRYPLIVLASAAVAALAAASPTGAQLLDDILLAPKTLVDRAIEARSSEDIYKDNEIVVKVNGIMADLETVSASTQIYEQRLLVTGIFNDEATYEKFRNAVHNVEGVKALYWHAVYVPEADEEAKKKSGAMLDWADVLVLESKAKARLIGTAGVADVNFRVAADPFGTVYLLGRARSAEELKKAVARARDGEGVKDVVSYVEVRP